MAREICLWIDAAVVGQRDVAELPEIHALKSRAMSVHANVATPQHYRGQKKPEVR
jgi:hypothetical protein